MPISIHLQEYPDDQKGLSQRRAERVKQFLINNGIDENRIYETIGMGTTNEFGDNSTEKGKNENQRVNINVVYEKKQLHCPGLYC